MQHTRISDQRANARREEGAAMLVVMLVLLVGTTVAAMSVHAITLETRSSGYYRQQAQSRYVAESGLLGVLSLEPDTVYDQYDRVRHQAIVAEVLDPTDENLITSYGEPDPAYVPGTDGKIVVRLRNDLVDTSLTTVALGGPPVLQSPDTNGSLGAQTFMPFYLADLSDIQEASELVPGQDASGNTREIYFTATVTLRGRTMLEAGGVIAADRGPSNSVVGNVQQQFTDGAYDMRVAARFGPVRR